MSDISFSLDNLRDPTDIAPLYCKYPRQTERQGAYIEIDEDGQVTADHNPEIGNAVPMNVYHNRTLRYGVSGAVMGLALADYLEGDGRALLERIHAGHSLEWNGNNQVGRLDEDAQEAAVALEQALLDLPEAEVWEADQWIAEDTIDHLWPKGTSLDRAAEQAQIPNAPNQVVVGDMNHAILDKAEAQSIKRLIQTQRLDIVHALFEAARIDAEDLAQAFNENLPEPVEALTGFDHTLRLEVYEKGDAAMRQEAEATLGECLRSLRDEGFDWSWLPAKSREILVKSRVETLKGWAESRQGEG